MPHETTATHRRDFLKIAALGPIAGAIAIGASDQADAEQSASEGEKQGYRETEHVRTFYRAARF